MEKRIETFKEFLQKKVDESSVNIKYGWDENKIIEQIIRELEKQCVGYMTLDKIIDFCKEKWEILGRPQNEDNVSLVIQHIKDLIFQHIWQTEFTSWGGGYNPQTQEVQEIHCKFLVIDKLACATYKALKKKLDIDNEETIGVLIEIPDSGDSDDENWDGDELPFESKRPVKGIEAYTKMEEEE